jgi:hypothetical protein
VYSRFSTRHLRQQNSALIPNLEMATERQNLMSILFQLPEAYYICGETRNKVNSGQHLVIAVLALEQD